MQLEYRGQIHRWSLPSWDVGWCHHPMTCWNANIVSGDKSKDLVIDQSGLYRLCGTTRQKCHHSIAIFFRKQWITLVIFQKIKAYQAVGFRLGQNLKNVFKFSSVQTYRRAYEASRINKQLSCRF